MSKLTALSVSIGVLGAIWTFLCLGPLAGFALVWAGFIAWACFFHTGGDEAALSKTITGNIYGIVIAWIALLIIVSVPVAALGPVWPAIVVGVTAFLLVIVASVQQLSVVPANVYGYAATAGYGLHQPDALKNLTTAGFSNPLLILILSMVLGAVFGYLSAKAGNMLAKESMDATAARS